MKMTKISGKKPKPAPKAAPKKLVADTQSPKKNYVSTITPNPSPSTPDSVDGIWSSIMTEFPKMIQNGMTGANPFDLDWDNL